MTYRQTMDRVVVPRLARVLRPLLPRLFSPEFLQRIGDSLVICTEPRPADLILVLGGGTRRRLTYGLEIYRAGLAPRVVLTNSVSASQLRGTGSRNSFEEMQRLGVPSHALTWLPWPRNTFEEAQAARALLSTPGVERLLVVTEPYHSRRVRDTFRRVMARQPVQLSVTCPPDCCAGVVRWWERRRDREGVLSELLSFGYYKLRGRL